MTDRARFDQNYRPSLIGVSNVDGETPVSIWGSPSTHRVFVDAIITNSTATTPFNNQKTVTTAGSRVQLQTNALTVGIIIQALSTNTGLIYVGDSAVSSSNGFELQAGQATSVAVSNTDAVWVDASVNGSKVCWIGS